MERSIASDAGAASDDISWFERSEFRFSKIASSQIVGTALAWQSLDAHALMAKA